MENTTLSLANELTGQPWKGIGEGPPDCIRATKDVEKMIDHNFAILERLLLRLIAHRTSKSADASRGLSPPQSQRVYSNGSFNGAQSGQSRNGLSWISRHLTVAGTDASNPRSSHRDEISVEQPPESSRFNDERKNGSESNISLVKKQLYMYVMRIANLYGGVHYHNFQHATHVALSANKLIDILLSCETIPCGEIDEGEGVTNEVVRNHENGKTNQAQGSATSISSKKSSAENFERNLSTFGISTDPLMHFTLVFSALVHDVQHKGLPNAQLVKEEDKLSAIYLNTSVAEQHSIAVAFSVLSESCFNELRRAIYSTQEECDQFRDLVIDLILCTDISSPERMALGKSKWNIAFPKDSLSVPGSMHRRHSDPIPKNNSSKDLKDKSMSSSANKPSSAGFSASHTKLKARVVMEQLMQIADVAHLMQDWPVFLKWNKNLYDELWAAKIADRGFDPSKNWFNGQISFLDNYVIPLSTRIYESGVFGAEGKSFMKNAIKNKEKWIEEGQRQSIEMITNISYIQPNIKTDSDQVVFDDTNHILLSRIKQISTTNRTTRAA